MIKSGRKTIVWSKYRAELKKEFEEKGVVSCELQLDGCQNNYMLSWSHGDKRRFLTDDELRHFVTLSCYNCHSTVEKWPRSELRKITQEIIDKRTNYD